MPDWLSRVRERFADINFDPATQAETIEELTQHVEDRYKELVARGVTEADASAQAMRELEGHERFAREVERVRAAGSGAPPSAQNTSHDGLSGIVDDMKFA